MINSNSILKFFNGVTFNEELHKYYYNGNLLNESVSSIIKRFTIQENWEDIAINISSKTGKDKDEILKGWKDKADMACSNGTIIHNTAESIANEIISGEGSYNYKIHNSNQEFIVEKFLTELPPYIKIVLPEIVMFHKEFLFPGTMDLLLFDERDGQYIICDYKTNENLFKNFANKKLLNVFNFLLDNSFNKYQIQLSFYQILIEQIKNLKIKVER